MMSDKNSNFIFDRSHIGEYVYAPIYRNYDGSYVFDLEKKYKDDYSSDFIETSILILLTSSDFSFIEDDGLSFNVDNKLLEQTKFLKAFLTVAKSRLFKSKYNFNGYYKSD